MTMIAKHLQPGLCLTPSDLRALGRGDFCYIRRYRVNGQAAFVIHAADGSAVGVQKDLNAAKAAAEGQNLEIASIH